MATAKEVQAQLTRALKDVGLLKVDFKTMQTGYDSLRSDKRIKADIEAWLKFGKGAAKAKDHLDSNSTNLNSGTFGKFCDTYFPLFTVQDRSNAIWLYRNHVEVKAFGKGKNLSNPASIRQAIHKDLKTVTKELTDSETKTAYEKYGFKAPANKGPVVRKTAAEKATEAGKTVIMEKLTIDQILPLLNHATEVLEQRARNNKKQFKEEQVHEIDNLSYRLSDLAESVHNALGTQPAQPKTATG